MKKPKIVLPHTKHRAAYNHMDNLLDALMQTSRLFNMPDDVIHLGKARETLASIRRLNGRFDAAMYVELLALLGMIVYNQIDHDGHSRAGMVVYPAMLALGFYVGLLMDKMDKKKDKLHKHMQDWVNTKSK